MTDLTQSPPKIAISPPRNRRNSEALEPYMKSSTTNAIDFPKYADFNIKNIPSSVISKFNFLQDPKNIILLKKCHKALWYTAQVISYLAALSIIFVPTAAAVFYASGNYAASIAAAHLPMFGFALPLYRNMIKLIFQKKIRDINEQISFLQDVSNIGPTRDGGKNYFRCYQTTFQERAIKDLGEIFLEEGQADPLPDIERINHILAQAIVHLSFNEVEETKYQPSFFIPLENHQEFNDNRIIYSDNETPIEKNSCENFNINRLRTFWKNQKG